MGFLKTNSQKNGRFCRFHGKFGTNFAEIRSLKKPIPQKHRLLINVTVLKPTILCSKPPLALRSPLDLVLSRTRFFLSKIISCPCNNDEFRSAPMAKLFISCTGRAQFFCNNYLRTRGSFGTFSCCRDKVSK